MKQAFRTLTVPTRGPGLYEFTGAVQEFVQDEHIENGLLTCFVRHTSASLLIQENADPDVQNDLQDFFAWLAKSGPRFRHTAEGPDDMPSHIRAALTQTSIGIPLQKARLALGTWQGIYLFEHRDAPHRREVMLHVLGD
ncbi:MAG TPA: secondary thiamine-phosphate synthase enzyme YjbQ [Rhizomicrobium sp.]|jgi:secondary thiamine-phosphate synthase enzyme|nr:secondary thiamine-phosphate synthase enzyme YjbQ [Rhizomicrobium sp.]